MLLARSQSPVQENMWNILGSTTRQQSSHSILSAQAIVFFQDYVQNVATMPRVRNVAVVLVAVLNGMLYPSQANTFRATEQVHTMYTVLQCLHP